MVNVKLTDFKSYCLEYVSGNVDFVFGELVKTKEVRESNKNGGTDLVHRIYYSINDLNLMFNKIHRKYSNYINYHDAECLFQDCVLEFFSKKLKEYDLDKLSDFDLRNKLLGIIKNKFRLLVEKDFGKNVETKESDGYAPRERTFLPLEGYNEETGEEYDITVEYVIEQNLREVNENEFRNFLEYIPLEKLLDEVLTGNQNKVYPYIMSYYNSGSFSNNMIYKGDIPRKEIANELGISEQALKDVEVNVAKRLFGLYRSWKDIRFKKEIPISQAIVDLIGMLNNLEKFSGKDDLADSKFAIFISWLKGYYIKGEAIDTDKEIQFMHKNINDNTETVFAVISDNFNDVSVKGDEPRKSWLALRDILEYNAVPMLSKKDKEKIVKRCVKILEKYLSTHYKYLYKTFKFVESQNKNIS